MSFTITGDNAKDFMQFTKIISETLEKDFSMRLEITERGFEISPINDTHCYLLDSKFPRQKFDKYENNGVKLIDLRFDKLPEIEDIEKIQIEIEPGENAKISYKTEDAVIDHTTRNHDDSLLENIEKPAYYQKEDGSTKLQIDSSILKKYVKQMIDLQGLVSVFYLKTELDNQRETLKLLTHNYFKEKAKTYYEKMGISINNNIKFSEFNANTSIYQTDIIDKFLKSIESKRIGITFKTNQPIEISYIFNDVETTLLLAPQVESEDDPYEDEEEDEEWP